MIYALGAFDGFHLGHQRLLDKARKLGAANGEGWGVITFANHPQTLFNRENFRSLFSDGERDLIAGYLGIPKMIKLPFDRMLANMSPSEFVDFLTIKNHVSGLVVGSNFCFGRARTGTPLDLALLCEARGWSLEVIEPCMIGGETVSSSAVRNLIVRGQIERGTALLGYPFIISGKVIGGDGRGRKLGFATANLLVDHWKVYPARGSYAAYAFAGEKWRPAALNIGYNPTFDLARRLRCEAHIIGFEGNLYEKEMRLFVFAKNRDEIKFESEGALKAQLERDMKNIKNLAEGYMMDNISVFRGFESLF